jgi:hypothetical protein
MIRTSMALIALTLCASVATAQFTWSDNFEAYNLGSLCSNAICANVGGSGGWAGWDNVDAGAAIVVDTTTAAFPGITPNSGSKMIEIGVAADAVQPFSLNYPGTHPTSGLWEVSAWTYIPTGANTAASWFIINNQYNHLGPYVWALQLQFQPNGTVTDIDRGGSVPIAFDQWVELKVFIDLDNDGIATSYNGQEVASGTFTTAAGNPLAIANIDLFTGGTVYYDDLAVDPAAPIYETNSPEASLDLNGLQGSAFQAAISGIATNTPTTLNIGSTLVGNGYDIAIAPSAVIPSFLTTPNLQVINVDLFNPFTIFLNSGTAALNLQPFPGNVALTFGTPGTPLTASAQMVVLDAGNPDGIWLSQAPQLDVMPCIPSQNFDSLALGNNAPFGWTNPSSGLPWTVDASGTPSAGTGPTAANSLPNYIYCETSTSPFSQTFVMDTCIYDASQFSSFTLNFALSRIGASTGTLNIYQDDGAGTFPTLLTTYTGPDPLQAQGLIEWSNESIPFTPAGSFVAFRFQYTAGATFTGDIAIDDFLVQ